MPNNTYILDTPASDTARKEPDGGKPDSKDYHGFDFNDNIVLNTVDYYAATDAYNAALATAPTISISQELQEENKRLNRTVMVKDVDFRLQVQFKDEIRDWTDLPNSSDLINVLHGMPIEWRLQGYQTRTIAVPVEAAQDWKHLREKFFAECVVDDSVDGPKLRIDYAPEDVFEWFKRNAPATRTPNP